LTNTQSKQPTLPRQRPGAIFASCALFLCLSACVQEGQDHQASEPNAEINARISTNKRASITIDSPANNAVVLGIVTISSTTTGFGNNTKVQYKLDNTNLGVALTQPPYSFAWNTTGFSNRSYQLSAVARDAVGHNSTTTITVIVNNLYDTQSPTAPTQVTALPVSATQIDLTWNASTDDVGVTGYTVYRSGTSIGTTATTNYSDASAAPSSQYAYTVAAFDAAGNVSPQSDPPVVGTTPVSDSTPPTVSFTNPGNNATVSNVAIVTASASDDVGIVGVQYKLDGNNLGAEVTDTPYNFAWDTTTVTNTVHTLSAVARDAAGNSSATTISVTVNNLLTDSTAPTAPANLKATAVSASQIDLTWDAATDDVGVTGYKVYRLGEWLSFAATTTTHYSNTGLAAASLYSYTVTAVDAAGNESLSSIAASASTPSSDATPPTVSFTNPGNNATLSNIVTLAASASDDIGVVGVQFKLDNNNLGAEISTGTYSFAWDTTTVSNATHTLTAVARDAAGNTASASITVTVNNPTLDVIAPTVPANLKASAVSASQINLAWNASTDAVGVAGYKVYRNGALIATRTTTSYFDTALTAVTNYTYTVAAFDAANNLSSPSSPAQATTLADSTKKSYSTTFDVNENPISEGGAWSNKGGSNWTNVKTLNGIASGTQSGTNGSGYDDSYATLSGFGPDHTASAIVHLANVPRVCAHEVELHLRWSDSAGVAQGYEVTHDAGATVQIVRWNGGYGDFYEVNLSTFNWVELRDGDEFKASIKGNVISVYLNNALIAQGQDDGARGAPYTTGNPGMGFFIRRFCDPSDTGTNEDFGFTSFNATEE